MPPRSATKPPSLVGAALRVPGAVFGEPDELYPARVLRETTEKGAPAYDVQFDVDASVYWFPAADVAKWHAASSVSGGGGDPVTPAPVARSPVRSLRSAKAGAASPRTPSRGVTVAREAAVEGTATAALGLMALAVAAAIAGVGAVLAARGGKAGQGDAWMPW